MIGPSLQEAYLEEELWSRRYAQNFDDSSDEEYALQNLTKRIRYKVNLFTLLSSALAQLDVYKPAFASSLFPFLFA